MQTQTAFNIKNYIDREAIESNTHHSVLYIYFSVNSISLVVASKNQDKILGLKIVEVKDENIFKKNTSALKEMLNALQFNVHEYASTKIIIENNCHTLVPEALFAGEKAASFLKLNTPIGTQHQVLFNRLPKNMVSVFAVNEPFYQSLKNIFPPCDIIHQSELLLTFLLASHQKENKDQLYIYMHQTYIEVAHLKNNELHYLNTFDVEADTDIIYFILSVAELLKLDQQKLLVSLFGNINASSSLIGLMKKYIAHVELMKRPEQYEYPASFREFQEQQYFIQICSLLCAS